jgi:hypothetical protein
MNYCAYGLVLAYLSTPLDKSIYIYTKINRRIGQASLEKLPEKIYEYEEFKRYKL